MAAPGRIFYPLLIALKRTEGEGRPLLLSQEAQRLTFFFQKKQEADGMGELF